MRLAFFVVGLAGCQTPAPTPASRVVLLPQGEVTVCDEVSPCAGGLLLTHCGARGVSLGCVPGARDQGPYDDYEGGVTW